MHFFQIEKGGTLTQIQTEKKEKSVLATNTGIIIFLEITKLQFMH
jgi:hypothetical protein